MNRRGCGFGCFGCGGTALLGLLVLALLAWNVVVKPARDFLAGYGTPAQTQTQSRTQTSPAGGDLQAALNRADLEKFVRIRRQVRPALGTSFSDLQDLLADLQAGEQPNLLRIGTVLRQTAGNVGAARTVLDRELAAQGMSRERYAAVRAAVNRVLGVPSLDLSQVATAVRGGQLPDLRTSVQTATPQEKALVAPFERELRASAAAGLLGM